MTSDKKISITLPKQAAKKGNIPDKIQSALNSVIKVTSTSDQTLGEALNKSKITNEKIIENAVLHITTPADQKMLNCFKEMYSIENLGLGSLTSKAGIAKNLKSIAKGLSKMLKIGSKEKLSYASIDILYGQISPYKNALTNKKGELERMLLIPLSHLTREDRNNFFFLLHKFNFQDDLEQAVKDKIVPIKWRGYYKKWKKFNDVSKIEKFYASKEESDNVEEALGIPAEELLSDDGITIIEAEHAFVIEGENDEMIATLYEENEGIETKPSHDRHLKRDKIIALLEETGIPKSSMTLYREKAVQGSQTNSYPYQVLDIQDEKLHAQIVLCNWTKFSTFILRNPAPMDSQNPIILSSLKDDDSVWRIVHNNEEQWIDAVYEHLFTPVSSLPVQFKHIVAWEDQKEQLLHSFTAHIAATGRIPRSNDTSLIEYGALKRKATWSRAYGALTRGSINGLGNIHNFHTLYDHLVAEDSRIENFKGRQPLPHAREIFNQCVRFARESGIAPQHLFYSDMLCFDRPAQQTSDGFTLHAIKGWKGLVNDPTQRPVSLDEFVVATGLATRNGNELELVKDLDSVVTQVKQRNDSFKKQVL